MFNGKGSQAVSRSVVVQETPTIKVPHIGGKIIHLVSHSVPQVKGTNSQIKVHKETNRSGNNQQGTCAPQCSDYITPNCHCMTFLFRSFLGSACSAPLFKKSLPASDPLPVQPNPSSYIKALLSHGISRESKLSVRL